MTNRLGPLLNRAKDIYQKEGLSATIKRMLAFAISLLSFRNSVFYVYVKTLKEENETDYLPKVQNSTHRIVETVEQLDELPSEGFDLSLLDINQSRYGLEKGAVLSLTFVDRELGYMAWSALTEEAKNTFNPYPYKVDFVNNESCGGASWVNPKYRRQGLAYYSLYKEEQFLMERGATKFRSIVLTSNIATQGWNAKRGARIVAKALYVRIFGLQFWRERPVKSTGGEG